MDDFLIKLFKAKQTVFSSKEVALLAEEKSANRLKSKLAYYVKTGKLLRLRRGFYAKSSDYEPREFASKIYTPAYVSFETVLAKEGVIFQYYGTVFVASYLSRTITTEKNQFVFRKMKNDLLVNQAGISDKGGYFEASKERALLDMLYLAGNYYFDNLRGVDWEACLKLAPIYKLKNFENKIKDYQKKYANQ